MKFTFIFKLSLILYLCISQSAIECIEITRVRRILHKAQKMQLSRQKLQQQQKLALYAKIASQFQTRDNNLSMFPDVNAQMLKLWKLVQADNTDYNVVEREEETLKQLYDANRQKAKSDEAQLKKIVVESESFKKTFDQAKLIDQDYEKSTAEYNKIVKEAQEDAKSKLLTEEQQKSKEEIALRQKYSLSDKIMQGQQSLMRIFTKFLHPTQDSKEFNRNLIKAIENSLPDKYCYKKTSALAAQQKLTCPTTHPVEALGFCVQTCDQGQAQRQMMPDSQFEKFLGVCWEQCKKKSCSKSGLFIYPEGYSWTNWHWQRSFIPDFKSVFSADVKCQENEVKWGFLCYQKGQECPNIGYKVCSSLACSINESECARVTREQVVATLVGISKFLLMFVAPGAANIISTAAEVLSYSNQLASLIQNMVESKNLLVESYSNEILRKRMIKNAIRYLKNNNLHVVDGVIVDDKTLNEQVSSTLTSQVERIIKKQADSKQLADKTVAAVTQQIQGKVKEASIFFAKDFVKDTASTAAQQALQPVITAAGESLKPVVQAVESVKESIQDITGDILEVFDVRLVQDVINVTKGCTSKDGAMNCAKGILGAIAVFDPTGLAGIAKAFMYNTCKDNDEL